MLRRAVKPGDCALALAIPLTEAEFIADLNPAVSMQLAKHITPARRCGKTLTPWERYREEVGQPVEQIAAAVEAAGVTVYRRVQLKQISSICAAHTVVTLVAHWEYLLLEPSDILDVDRFQRILASGFLSASGEPRAIDSQLRNDALVTSARTPIALASALCVHLAAGRRYHLFETEIDIPPSSVAPLSSFSRLLLEEFYPGCFAPGRCIELANRLCTAWEVLKEVPEKYDGLFDLTLCHSIILAEFLKRHREQCNAICLVGLASPDVRLTLYKWVIRQLAACAQPYEDAAAGVHAALIAEIRRRRSTEEKQKACHDAAC